MTDVDEVGPKLLDQYHLPEEDKDVLRHIDRITQESLKDQDQIQLIRGRYAILETSPCFDDAVAELLRQPYSEILNIHDVDLRR